MKKTVETEMAPGAIGPYSQAVVLGNMVFTSGQLPLDPVTMAFPEGGIREQTSQSLRNVQAILEGCGASLDTVVKTTCFLADMTHFSEFNDVYSGFFGTENAPARSCVQAAKLPKDALAEVEVVAFIPGK